MIPPRGAVPQQQVQGGIPAVRQAPQGAVPQAPQQGASKDPKQVELLRMSPNVQKAIEMFVGRKVDMAKVPEEIIIEVGGMVAKLGVQGAVAMAEKMLPPQVKQQLRGGNANGQ